MASSHMIQTKPRHVDEDLVRRFAAIRNHCLHDISNKPKHEICVDDSRICLTSRTEEELRRHIGTPAGKKDWEARIELALRYLAQSEISGKNHISSASEALIILSQLCDNPERDTSSASLIDSPDSGDGTYPPPAPKILAQAHALAMYAYLSRYNACAKERGVWMMNLRAPDTDYTFYILRDLFYATTYARLAARADFVPSIMLHVVAALRTCAGALDIRLQEYGRLKVIDQACLKRGVDRFDKYKMDIPATLPLCDQTKEQLEEMFSLEEIVWETLAD